MPHASQHVDKGSYRGERADKAACEMKRDRDVVTAHRRQLLLGAASLGCAFALGACSSVSSTTAVGSISNETPKGSAEQALDARSPVKVAMLLPLTGSPQTAAVAKGLRQAGELALFERNTPSLQIVMKDDKGTEEGARAAAEEAIKEGAELIIGPLFAKSVAAIAPLSRQAGVPIIAFSNDVRVAGNGVYLLSFLPAQDVPRIVSYAASQGRRRFAALLPDDALGKVQEPLFRAAVEHNGGTVVALERYPLEVSSMVEPVQRIRDIVQGAEQGGAPVEALFLPGGPDTLPLIGPMLPQRAVDPHRIKIIGTGGWDYPNAGRERILENGWFAAPDPRGWREFSERFANTYKNMPPRLASLAYDAVGIAATFATAPKGARYTPANLTRASGFNGVDGTLRLLPNGQSERGLAILEMQKFGPSVVEPAPALPSAPQTLAGVSQFGFN